MDKFPTRRQGNKHWGSRHSIHTTSASTIPTTPPANSTTINDDKTNNNAFKVAFATPSRVGMTLPQTHHPLMDTVSAPPNPLHNMGSPPKRPLHGMSRRGPKHMPTSTAIPPSSSSSVSSAVSGGGQPSSSGQADRLFKMRVAEKNARLVLAEKLKEVTYDSTACRDICPDIASAILNKVQDTSLKQYKLVCVVSVGSLKEKPGVQFGSRCLWNKDTDNFVSVKYSNGSVYAVALIFGLYFE